MSSRSLEQPHPEGLTELGYLPQPTSSAQRGRVPRPDGTPRVVSRKL
jgi:hypothetical protein